MSEPLSTEYDATGAFDEMFELACRQALMEGDEVLVHRPFDIEHLEGADCPCNPLVVSSDTPRKPKTILDEIESCDG